MGIIGSFLLSNFSLVMVIDLPGSVLAFAAKAKPSLRFHSAGLQ
jgi:hypothetical protein